MLIPQLITKVNQKNSLYWIITSGILLRLLFFISDGHNMDINHFRQWAIWGSTEGISTIYNHVGQNFPCDYPPLYLYFLTGLGYIFNFLGINMLDSVFPIIIKSVTLAFELIFLLFIWKKTKNNLLLFILLFNPVTIINAYGWGQVDMLFTSVLLAAFYFLYQEKLLLTAVLLAIAVNLKTQTLLFLPLFGIIALINKQTIRTKLIAIFAFLFTFLVINLPFILFATDPWIFLFPHTTASGRYPYISVNAFNVWWGLFADYSLKMIRMFPAPDLFIAGIISIRNFAFLLFAIIYAGILGLIVWKKLNFYQLSQLFAFFCFSYFMFLPEMHERYLFPFFFFSAFVCLASPKEIPLFIIIALLHSFNLFWAWGEERHFKQYWLFETGRYVSIIMFIIWIAYARRSYLFIFKESHNLDDKMLSIK